MASKVNHNFYTAHHIYNHFIIPVCCINIHHTLNIFQYSASVTECSIIYCVLTVYIIVIIKS